MKAFAPPSTSAPPHGAAAVPRDPSQPLPRSARDWVESQLVSALMRTVQNNHVVGIVLIAIVVAVLWDGVSVAPLLVWSLLALASAGLRYTTLRHFRRLVASGPPGAAVARFPRLRNVFLLGGLTWGALVWVFFDRAPAYDQFLCWLVLAGVAMFSINSFSLHLQTMRRYLDLLAAAAAAGLVGRLLWTDVPSRQEWWLLPLVALFWIVLRQAGQRLHATHRSNFELQWRNDQLIDSLRRQTRAALEAVGVKNRLIASAAHDIRQPVLALGLYADWLGSEPDMAAEIAPKIVQSTKAVNSLFDSLFDLARLDAGKIRVAIEPVDIAELLRQIETQHRLLAQARGVELRLRARDGTLVMTDPILLGRVVGNLVSNAIKYTERGGVLLALRGCGRARTLRIEIWDTGVGIEESQREAIFGEFYKVPGHTGTSDGFGLGLYIVGKLVNILGHPLTLASRLGRGTVFRLGLPDSDETAANERAVLAAVEDFDGPATSRY